jgi:predicted phage terminase large subunit-like protein
MMSSYDPALCLRDARRTKRLVESEWYRDLWPETRIVTNKRESTDSAGIYYTTAGGLRFSSQIGSTGVGWHCHHHVIDDPHKPLDTTLESGVTMDRAWAWLGLMATRGVPGQAHSRVIIMQRLHEFDMAGRVLRSGGWKHVCLPMHHDPSRDDHHPEDPRRERGELLNPDLKDLARVDSEARNMRAAGADVEAQHEQRPTPPGGKVFKREWWKFWKELPDHGLVFAQSWDFTFGEKANSWVVGQLWATDGETYYLVDQTRRQTDYPGMKTMLRTFYNLGLPREPRCTYTYIEGAALGKAIVQELSGEIANIEEVSVSGVGGKLVRARAVTGTFADGHVCFPDPEGYSFIGRKGDGGWVRDLITRFERFTGAAADVADEVDCASQVLIRMHAAASSRFSRAMKAARDAR